MADIKEFLKGKIGNLKKRTDKNFNHQMNVAKMLPTFILQAMLYVVHFISYNLGFSVKALKVREYEFGTGVLTNVTGFKFDEGFAPHIEFCNTNYLMVITNPRERAVVVDGKPSSKKIIYINMTFDQRYSEGEDVYEAVKRIREVWENPKNYL